MQLRHTLGRWANDILLTICVNMHVYIHTYIHIYIYRQLGPTIRSRANDRDWTVPRVECQLHGPLRLLGTRLLHTCDITLSHVWHDSAASCVEQMTWLPRAPWCMTHSIVGRDSFIRKTWLISSPCGTQTSWPPWTPRYMTRSCAWYDSL